MNQVPESKVPARIHISDDDFQKLGCEDSGMSQKYHDSVVHVPHSTRCGGAESFEEIFGDLSNINAELIDEPTFAVNKEDESTARKTIASDDHEAMEIDVDAVLRDFEHKRKQKEQKPKRKRAAERHNMAERSRRNRIRTKLKALQELVPNCNKTDRASMLEDTINHIKALQQYQEQYVWSMWSMGGVVLYQHPNLPMAGAQTSQIPQFMPFMPMGGASPYVMGMGMVNMCYPLTSPPVKPKLTLVGQNYKCCPVK